MFRSHNLGELNLSDINKDVTLCGWVHKTRDLGGMTFVDLRDRYGRTQLVFNADINKESLDIAKKLSLEDVIGIQGKVVLRPNEAKNNKVDTGLIDVEVNKLIIYII